MKPDDDIHRMLGNVTAIRPPKIIPKTIEAARNGAVDARTADAERILPAPGAPLAVARELIATRYTSRGVPILRRWRGGWWLWKGPRWMEVEAAIVLNAIYTFTEGATYLSDKGEPKDWSPTAHKVNDVLHALGAVVHLEDTIDQPSWIDGPPLTDHAIISTANGLLDVVDRKLMPHTPTWFSSTSVPFDYDPHAPAPTTWLAFLHDLWGEDPEQVSALQEWFGYTISGRTDLHKILLIVGPTRAGKGVIARTLSGLIGRQNVAGPTLSSLGGEFGLAPLLSKPLAVVSDARLGGRDTNIVVERLLSISGEDLLTINRKYRDQWTGKLPARFVICSNELPRLGDASAAIAGRFVTLLLTRSFYGHEDLTLETRIADELPGVLDWTLSGLAALNARGEFTRPQSTREAYMTLRDLASPVSAFIRDRCNVGPDEEVLTKTLYNAYRDWAEENGHPKNSSATFGRDLRASLPSIRHPRPRDAGGERIRMYAGIGLKP